MSPVIETPGVTLKVHAWAGSTTAIFKERMRREAMIGAMIVFALVNTGYRQPPRGCTNAGGSLHYGKDLDRLLETQTRSARHL